MTQIDLDDAAPESGAASPRYRELLPAPRRVPYASSKPIYWEPFGAGSVAILQCLFWVAVFVVVWQVYGFDGGPPELIRYTGPTTSHISP